MDIFLVNMAKIGKRGGSSAGIVFFTGKPGLPLAGKS
jgi:hypothetical protein